MMCGQCGLILGRKRRRYEEREYLKGVFTHLLLLGEPRGPHATGLAWVNRDGEHRIFKGPLPASQFIWEKSYQETLDGLDNHTTILMGHTRWPTRGDVRNNRNNHPLRCLDCLGTAYAQSVIMHSRAALRGLLLAFRPAALHIISNPPSIKVI